jgi:hypothetical protein
MLHAREISIFQGSYIKRIIMQGRILILRLPSNKIKVQCALALILYLSFYCSALYAL